MIVGGTSTVNRPAGIRIPGSQKVFVIWAVFSLVMEPSSWLVIRESVLGEPGSEASGIVMGRTASMHQSLHRVIQDLFSEACIFSASSMTVAASLVQEVVPVLVRFMNTYIPQWLNCDKTVSA